ncbi:MAG: PepSY domain-containing protein [Alphaproteobacteria bacterium]
MAKILAYAAAGLMIAAAFPAFASGGDDSCGTLPDGPQLSVQEIADKAGALGYDVRKVKREDNCFEVYAIDENGARVEIYMNPVTGAVMKTKKES